MRTHFRELNAINAGSMADIAFLLLIFFLITTTMNTDQGILRILPALKDDPKSGIVDRYKRNVLDILVNSHNKLMVDGKEMKYEDLKERAKEFIENPSNRADLPERKLINIENYGPAWVTDKHIISLKSDRGTSYKTYITIQNELTKAYNELRNEAALKKWRIPYSGLDKKRKNAIETIYHSNISEAEPNNSGTSE